MADRATVSNSSAPIIPSENVLPFGRINKSKEHFTVKTDLEKNCDDCK